MTLKKEDPKKHHYIPQLHLKGFVNEKGKLKGFDKMSGTFIKEQSTPKTIMFEKHRNTIEINGEKTVVLEKLYSALENQYGILFDKIRKGLILDKVNNDDFSDLMKGYLAYQFWRLPILDSFSEKYIDSLDLKSFGKRITVNGVNLGDVEWFEQLLKKDKSFKYYFRCFYLPILSFDIYSKSNSGYKFQILNVSNESDGWNNIICSDFPIIIENIEHFFRYESSFIFPLSKNQILIYHNKDITNVPPIFTTYLSMIQYGQSIRYTIGEDETYISKVIDLYENIPYDTNEDKLELLKRKLFNYLK